MKQYSFLQEGIAAFANKAAGNAFKYGGKITKITANNPKITGTVAGAGIGAATGLKKDENGERHILRNASVGAGVGLAGGVAGQKFLKGKGQVVQNWMGKQAGKRFTAAKTPVATTTALTTRG